MRKKLCVVLVVLFVFFPQIVFAEDTPNGFYMGVGFWGVESPQPKNTHRIPDGDTHGMIFGGYQITNSTAVEVGHFSEINTTFVTVVAEKQIDNYANLYARLGGAHFQPKKNLDYGWPKSINKTSVLMGVGIGADIGSVTLRAEWIMIPSAQIASTMPFITLAYRF